MCGLHFSINIIFWCKCDMKLLECAYVWCNSAHFIAPWLQHLVDFREKCSLIVFFWQPLSRQYHKGSSVVIFRWLGLIVFLLTVWFFYRIWWLDCILQTCALHLPYSILFADVRQDWRINGSGQAILCDERAMRHLIFRSSIMAFCWVPEYPDYHCWTILHNMAMN